MPLRCRHRLQHHTVPLMYASIESTVMKMMGMPYGPVSGQLLYAIIWKMLLLLLLAMFLWLLWYGTPIFILWEQSDVSYINGGDVREWELQKCSWSHGCNDSSPDVALNFGFDNDDILLSYEEQTANVNGFDVVGAPAFPSNFYVYNRWKMDDFSFEHPQWCKCTWLVCLWCAFGVGRLAGINTRIIILPSSEWSFPLKECWCLYQQASLECKSTAPSSSLPAGQCTSCIAALGHALL